MPCITLLQCFYFVRYLTMTKTLFCVDLVYFLFRKSLQQAQSKTHGTTAPTMITDFDNTMVRGVWINMVDEGIHHQCMWTKICPYQIMSPALKVMQFVSQSFDRFLMEGTV